MTHVLVTGAAGATTVAVAAVPGQAIVVKGFVSAAVTSTLSSTVRCLSNATAISPWFRTAGNVTFQLVEGLGSVRTAVGEDLVLDNPLADGVVCLISYEVE